MIELEGRMLLGLDEFMLRLGHLKLICAVADEVGGSWFRINRDAERVLTKPVPICADRAALVAFYLHRKRLCHFVECGKEEGKKLKGKYRYPNLVVEANEDGLSIKSSTEPPVIWWQDACLAAPSIASRVGGITVAGKAGSKTGLSHINDWAQLVGLISRAGEVSPIGRLIIRLGPRILDDQCQSNPYVIGYERIALAFTIISADVDCFSRFAPKLLQAKAPIRKAEGAHLFASTVQELAKEAREARYLSGGRKNSLYENIRDLENATRRGRQDLGSTSTAWHRASSRLETYVDLGLLEKGRGGERERFEYTYYQTPALEYACQSLLDSTNAREWLEQHLASVLFHNKSLESMNEGELLNYLPRLVASLARPTGPLPIDALALGLAWLAAENGQPTSIKASRQCLEQLAHKQPGIARLSRGRFGNRAEFISLDVRKLEGLSA